MKAIFLALALISTAATAKRLNNVKILDIKSATDKVSLTLQTEDGPKDSFFRVDVMKDDPQAFEKLAQITQKFMHADAFRLNLDIDNFSAVPSGSYYRSPSVKFLGSPSEHAK